LRLRAEDWIDPARLANPSSELRLVATIGDACFALPVTVGGG
jgi:hypothetical protein